jgi:FkbM family methyltransferase
MTLLASRHIGNTGFIYAFEPSERNRWYLEHHIQWNNLQRQVTVFPLAISDADDERDFHNRGSGTGRLAANAEEADIRITVRSIDSLVAAGECLPPTFLKVDIEGAEADLLRGAEKTLRGADACIVLATHSPELHKECAAILKDYGYAVHDPDRLQKALTEGWNSVKIEPEILAVGPGRTVSEADILAFQRCE